MIVILSPSKGMNFEPVEGLQIVTSDPRFLPTSNRLLSELRKWSIEDFKSIMHLSNVLAKEKFDNLKSFKSKKPLTKANPAIFAYDGDVYGGLNARSLDEESLNYASNSLRILSGLYGLLRPFDLVQPYRLEIGLNYKFEGRNLYQIWRHLITTHLLSDIKKSSDNLLINLASKEYSKVLDFKKLEKITCVEVEFLDGKDFKVISFNAKKARGQMARYILQNRVNSIEQLKKAKIDGYTFHETRSTDLNLVFHKI
jgi:uncharacterized protein